MFICVFTVNIFSNFGSRRTGKTVTPHWPTTYNSQICSGGGGLLEVWVM